MSRGYAKDMIMERILDGSDLGAEHKNPTVISCGGIYIPHNKARERVLYHIINTASGEEPVKVVSGYRPRNVLHEIMSKESKN